MDDVIVGLDIGTTKTCAVIGFLNESGQVEVAGVGVAPSRGLKNGVIINIDSTVQSIVKAIEDAELMAGCEVSNVFVNISGLHMKGENSKGVVAVSSRNRTISHSEIKRVIARQVGNRIDAPEAQKAKTIDIGKRIDGAWTGV